MATNYTSPMTSMFGPTAGINKANYFGTAPIAAATPVSGSGVNPNTGAYYSGLQKTPPAGTAPTGGSTLATYSPSTNPDGSPNNTGAGTYYDPSVYTTGSGTGAPKSAYINDYNGSIYAGNGTYGALGTNAPTGGIGNVSGGSTTGVAATDAPDAPADPSPVVSSDPPTYGTMSGPGLLDQWFNERATGTDPGWEYTTGRNATALNNQYAARGGYNSGAATQGLGDMYSNEEAQRESQLDSLAGGASGENQANLNSLLGLGMGLAGGEAGTGAAYDTGAASAMSGANNTGLGIGAQGIGLTYGANQGLMNQLLGLGTVGLLA